MTARGFSLVEVLLYLALFSILMTGTFSGAYMIAGSVERTRAQARLEQEAAFVLGRFRSELQETTIITPSSGSSDDRLMLRTNKGQERSFHTEEGILLAADDRGALPLSPYQFDDFSLIRKGTRGDATDPEYLEVSFTLTTQAKGETGRIFQDVLYLEAL